MTTSEIETDRTERNRQLVRSWLDAYCTFDPAQYEHLLTEDPYYRVAHSEHHGREGFAEVARLAAQLYPNGMRPEIEQVIVEGNHVAARITVTAVTNKGEDYFNYYALHLEVTDDGRIAKQFEYPDTAYGQDKFSFEGLV